MNKQFNKIWRVLKPITFHSCQNELRYVYICSRPIIGRHVTVSNTIIKIENYLPLMTARWKRLLRQIVLTNNYALVDEVTVRPTQISQ